MGSNYTENDIKSFSFMEHVRVHPDMWMGKVDLRANYQCIKEYIDNAVDEGRISVNRRFYIDITLYKGETTYQVVIRDHGRGIPCNKLETVLTSEFSTGKSGDAYTFSTGTFGIGAKGATALSDKMLALTKRPDGFAGLTTRQGKVVKSEVYPALDDDPKTVGTIIVHQPDSSILTYTPTFFTAKEEGINKLMELIEYFGAFTPNIRFKVYQVNRLLPDSWFNQSYQEAWQYLQKTRGELIYATPKEIDPESYVRTRFDISDPSLWQLNLVREAMAPNSKAPDKPRQMKVDINIHVVKHCAQQKGYIAAVNVTPISDRESSHLCVFLNKLKDRLRPYINHEDIELITYFNQSYVIPFYGHIFTYLQNATMEGQTKHGFKDPDFEKVYGRILEQHFKLQPDAYWEQLFNLIADDLLKRFSQDHNRKLNLTASSRNLAYGLNRIGSYVPAQVTDPDITELFITEGNSAGDFVVQHRDKTFQAVHKLKGKPINATTASAEKLRANEVYQDLIKILGVSPRDTDLSRMRFRRVGILADADPDGYHIITLVLAALLKINPLILEQGRVFLANPPLFIMSNRNESLFLKDQHALNDARVKIYEKFFQLELQFNNGQLVNLTREQYRDFIYLTKQIGDMIDISSRKLRIEPLILEGLIHCVDYLSNRTQNSTKIKQILQLDNCWRDPSTNSWHLIVNGADTPIPAQGLKEEITDNLLPLLTRVHWDKYTLLVSTKTTPELVRQPMSFIQFYQILDRVDQSCPIHRLKGLGEYSGSQLKRTCLDPATRTFTIITSIGEVERIYEMMGVDATPRKELLTGSISDEYSLEKAMDAL